jgi:hypothetical protein
MRVVDRLLSVVIALALLALGLVAAAEVVHTLLGQPGYLVLPWETLASWARSHSFGDAVVLAVGGVVGVAGLALIVGELGGRRPALHVLEPRTDGVVTAVTRASLNRALAARADDVDGVRGASSRLRRRRADLTAVTLLRDPGDLATRVDAAVTEWVGHLGLVAPPAVRVRLKRKASS